MKYFWMRIRTGVKEFLKTQKRAKQTRDRQLFYQETGLTWEEYVNMTPLQQMRVKYRWY